MKEKIVKQLKQIEQEEQITILYAVESGSRAWGFESDDSDYDVRFIYYRPLEEYLRFDRKSDVLEYMLEDNEFDLVGWDIDKTLKLAYKSNPSLFEWINSPIVYQQNPKFEKIKEEITIYWQELMSLHHYFEMAKKNRDAYLSKETVKLKKYFYVIRALLACRWILNRHTMPPIQFRDLVDAELEKDLIPNMNQMIEEKKSSRESDNMEQIQLWLNWITDNLIKVEYELQQVPKKEEVSWDKLNSIFRELILK